MTTIALIQSEFGQHSPEDLILRNNPTAAKQSALLESAATLIICPPHIALQWMTELAKFLGEEQLRLYNVQVIQSFADLKRLTIDSLLNSRVTIVSWHVLALDDYIAELAWFAAMPEPALTSRRAFDAWLSRALLEIPDRLEMLQSQGFQRFQQETERLITERQNQPQFQASIPLRVYHGNAYQDAKSRQTSSKSKGSKAKGRSKPKRDDTPDVLPLLHLFRFNRVVVDEYHYLNDTKRFENSVAAMSIKQIAGLKRWVLSGTPALANFSDVDQIASFFGVRLGRNFFGDGTMVTQVEKVRRGDQTYVENFLSQTDIKSRQWHQARHERAQEFLDGFVRQNEAELQHISCSEVIVPIELDAAHHAVYLELSQHLIAQRMQIKKLSRKSGSDKISRLNESLEDSSNAEEALLKSALLFGTTDEESGLDLLAMKRLQQRNETEKELMQLLRGFEGLLPTEKRKLSYLRKNDLSKYTKVKDECIVTLYKHFDEDIKLSNWLGDDEACDSMRSLLQKAKAAPNSKFVSELRGKSDAARQPIMKKWLSELREVSREYTLRIRSERFVRAVKDALQHSQGKATFFSCSAPRCAGAAVSLSEIRLITQCGHTASKQCLSDRLDDGVCVHPDCNSPLHDMDLIRMSDLGPVEHEGSDYSFGRKLEGVIQLIRTLPADDQGIVFVPNEGSIAVLEWVFEHCGITYHSLSGNAKYSAKTIEDFKTNTTKKSKKVLILSLESEYAAGV